MQKRKQILERSHCILPQGLCSTFCLNHTLILCLITLFFWINNGFINKRWVTEQKISLKKFFFTIVDLQCSVNFCCKVKWPSYTYRYIYDYILFFTLSSIMFHCKWLDIVPCAIQQDLIAYPRQCSSLHLLTPKIMIKRDCHILTVLNILCCLEQLWPLPALIQ